MGSSLAVISLALITLLTGLAIAIYQLWSANESQKEGEHSALARRFGGKPMNKALKADAEAGSSRVRVYPHQ